MHCWGIMTSSNGNIFRVTGPLWGEFTGHRWIPLTKASDAELLVFSLICAWTNGWANHRDTSCSLWRPSNGFVWFYHRIPYTKATADDFTGLEQTLPRSTYILTLMWRHCYVKMSVLMALSWTSNNLRFTALANNHTNIFHWKYRFIYSNR